jgi:hypothetical protein
MRKPKKSIHVLRGLQGVDTSDAKCAHCMDSGECCICRGTGLVPTWDPETGKFRQFGGRVQCWNCKGKRHCPDCSAEQRATA